MGWGGGGGGGGRGGGIVVEGDIMHWEPRPRDRKENFPQLTRARG